MGTKVVCLMNKMYLKGDTKLVNFLCHIFYMLFKKHITLDIIMFNV